MSKTIGLRYKTAREHLKLNKSFLKKQINIDYSTINRIENDKADSPNWTYTKYLVESGINYFYLIGVSDEIEGQKLDEFISKNKYDELKEKYEKLENKFTNIEEMLKLLQIEVDEDGNLKKRT